MLFGEYKAEKNIYLLALLATVLTVISKPFEKCTSRSKQEQTQADFDFTFDFDDYIRSNCE